MKHDKEKETTAHGHVATLSTAERVRGIKKEITLDEDYLILSIFTFEI